MALALLASAVTTLVFRSESVERLDLRAHFAILALPPVLLQSLFCFIPYPHLPLKYQPQEKQIHGHGMPFLILHMLNSDHDAADDVCRDREVH
jgi:hypothetical protein